MNWFKRPNTPKEDFNVKKYYIQPQTKIKTSEDILQNLGFSLYDIDLDIKTNPTSKGEVAELAVETDEKWNKYIEIYWKKCYERQKWINWFTYRRNADYPRTNKNPITIGLCINWKFTSSIEITEKWEPEKSELIDGKLSEILWFDFYIANGKLPKMNSSIKDALPLNPINLGNFKKYEKWISWLCYIEFKKKNEYGNETPWILLAKFNDKWEIIWPCRCLRDKGSGYYEYWENLIAKPKKVKTK